MFGRLKHTLPSRRWVGPMLASALLAACLLVADALALLPDAKAAQAPAERRIAMVIGNSTYRDLPLNNPANDARLISANLRKLGFEVNEHLNLGVRDFRRVLRDFARRVQEDDAVAVLYYAGHGVQIDGRNYLLPVDINLRDEEEVKDESVDIDELYISRLERARSKARIVILDACRDNPFRGRTRNIRASGGLAEMSARGTLIAFSSAPGAAAEDGPPGSHSVYTRHLADEMAIEGIEVEQMFKNVRVKVLRDTNQRQVPWVNTSLTVDFSFNPGTAINAADFVRQERIQRLEAELEQTRRALEKAELAAAAPAVAGVARPQAQARRTGDDAAPTPDPGLQSAGAPAPTVVVPAVAPNAIAGTRPDSAYAAAGTPASISREGEAGRLHAQIDSIRYALNQAIARYARQEGLVQRGRAAAATLGPAREQVEVLEIQLRSATQALAEVQGRPATVRVDAGAPSEEFQRLKAQLESTRRALEEARGAPVDAAATAIGDSSRPAYPPPVSARGERLVTERGTSTRTTAGRERTARCAELLHRASMGDELNAEEETLIHQECKK